jgi:hypothetical protein
MFAQDENWVWHCYTTLKIFFQGVESTPPFCKYCLLLVQICTNVSGYNI